jgi:poly-gamma-glutamate synthesis protein (capsule biosynthesis protein)
MRYRAFVGIISLALGLIASCAPSRTEISIECEQSLRPKLDELLRQVPLPKGYALESGTQCALKLSYASAKTSPAGATASEGAGTLWRGVALPLDDPRFDLSVKDAASLGTEPLDEICPPLRAPKIDGFWPGEPGYPLAYRLTLSLNATHGGIPHELLAWLETAAKTASAQEARPIVLAATGDLETGTYGSSQLLKGENGIVRLLSPQLLSAMQTSDILVGNLEGQITARGDPDPTKRYRFRFPPGCAAAYRKMGFDLMLLANNHSMDFGSQGLLDTINDLTSAGLPFVGAGPTAGEALQAKEAAGLSSRGIVFIGIGTFPKETLGFSTARAAATASSPGIVADIDSCVASIQAASQRGSMVVVLVHGGVEFSDGPDESTRAIFYRLADAGAALVIGSHPHVLHGTEARGSSIIAYSLGNFLFTDRVMPPIAQSSAVMSFLVYRGKVRGLDILPIIVSPTGTSIDLDPTDAKLRFVAMCSRLSAHQVSTSR